MELANTRGEASLLALVRFGCTSPSRSLPVFKIVLTRQSPLAVVPRLAGTILLVRLGVGDSAAAMAAFTAATMRRRRWLLCVPAHAQERERTAVAGAWEVGWRRHHRRSAVCGLWSVVGGGRCSMVGGCPSPRVRVARPRRRDDDGSVLIAETANDECRTRDIDTSRPRDGDSSDDHRATPR